MINLKEKSLNLPLHPGVYIMKDKDGTVIYVGKAKKLRNRVSSYFHGTHNEKTTKMVSCVNDFEVILADSEFEALVLENQLIKHYSPKYNILLKDDKGYPYVRIDTKSEYPSFSLASCVKKDGAEYFGPFGGRVATKESIDAICKALKLPTCSRKFPRDIGKERPCLNYQIGLCNGYCLSDTKKDEYRQSMQEAILLLNGKGKELVDNIKNEMEKNAAELQFEKAAELRDRINALSILSKKQRVVALSMTDSDVWGFYRNMYKCSFSIMHYIDGQLLSKDTEIIDNPMEDDAEALSLFIRQYYLKKQNFCPKNIFVPIVLPDKTDLELFFSKITGGMISISVPQRGDKYRLIEKAAVNAKDELDRFSSREERISSVLLWLKDSLGIDSTPNRIESFDISNMGSTDITSSMVVFQNGKPLKNSYRHFNIQGLNRPNDFESMYQTIYRRLRNYTEDNEKFNVLPDLIFVDGGQEHVKSAVKAMKEFDLNIPIFGMVKDSHHRTRELVSYAGHEIGISSNQSVFAFIGQIQEETHRFAIEFTRKSHKNNAIKSELDKIPGVGEKRKNELLHYFKSIKNISNATYEELVKIVPNPVAKNIIMYYKDKKK